MLTMQEIHHIQYEHDMKKKALREISRDTGRNFRTVRKYATMEDFNVELRRRAHAKGSSIHTKKRSMAGSGGPHARPKQRHTAKRVYDRLKESMGTIFRFRKGPSGPMYQRRKRGWQAATHAIFPLEHSPAEGKRTSGCSFFEKGIPYDGHYINLSFPHSNAGYMRLVQSAEPGMLAGRHEEHISLH